MSIAITLQTGTTKGPCKSPFQLHHVHQLQKQVCFYFEIVLNNYSSL